MTRFRSLTLVSLLLMYVGNSCQYAQPPQTEYVAELVSDTLTEYETAPVVLAPSYTTKQKDSILSVYEVFLQETLQQRQLFKQAYISSNSSQRDSVLNASATYLRNQLTQHILPCWYGTPWDFNGHINRPQKGQIACGYFVSTPLRHIGFQLNRYKLAQQASATIVDRMCSPRKRFRSVTATLEYIRSQPDDLYLVGLDYHVGFLHKAGDRINFIHSTYVDPGCAMTEPAEDSWVLSSSGLYVLGHLSSNPELVKAWLLQTEITVH